jgi:conjugative transfer region protein (TIGR03750 family)
MKSPGLDRVNEQPPVLLGLSQSELFVATGIGFLLTPVILVLIFALIWIWWIGLVISSFVGVFVVRGCASLICRLKIGKPENYYPLLVKQRLAALLGAASMQHDGPWAVIRRSRFEGKP